MLIASPHVSRHSRGATDIPEGYGSLRQSAFGAARYCPSLRDVSGQIHAFKMPVLTDKGRGEQLA